MGSEMCIRDRIIVITAKDVHFLAAPSRNVRPDLRYDPLAGSCLVQNFTKSLAGPGCGNEVLTMFAKKGIGDCVA